MKVRIVPALTRKAILKYPGSEFHPGDIVFVTTEHDSYAVVLGDVKKESRAVLIVPKSVCENESKGEITKIEVPNARKAVFIVNLKVAVPSNLVVKEVTGKIVDLGQKFTLVLSGRNYNSLVEAIAYDAEPEFPVRIVDETEIIVNATSDYSTILSEIARKREERAKRWKQTKIMPTKEKLLEMVSAANPVQKDFNLYMSPETIRLLFETTYPSYKVIREVSMERGKTVTYFDEKRTMITFFFTEGGKNTLVSMIVKSLENGEKIAEEMASLLTKNDHLYKYRNLCPQCGARIEWQEEIPSPDAKSFRCSFCGEIIEITEEMRSIIRGVMRK